MTITIIKVAIIFLLCIGFFFYDSAYFDTIVRQIEILLIIDIVRKSKQRQEVNDKYVLILNKIIEFQNEKNEKLKEQKKIELKLLLSKKSSYTMLCRSMPAVITALKDIALD